MNHAQSHLDYADFATRAAEAHAGLAALTQAVDASGLDKGLIELIKLRVSQINDCPFCRKVHLELARKAGVEGEKLDALPNWREATRRDPAWSHAGVFSSREKAALAYAEALTRLEAHTTPGEAMTALRAIFSEDEAMYLTIAVASINAWNRLGIGFGFSPPA